MKNLIVLALALGLATAATAQQVPAPAAAPAPATADMHMGGKHHRHTAAERAKNQADMMTEQLQLTGDTRAKVEEILRTRMEKVEALQAQQASSVKPQIAAIRSETDAALKGVLTTEQYVKYQTLKQEKKAHHMDRKAQKYQRPTTMTE